MKYFGTITVLLASTLLIGCAERGVSDLQRFVKETHKNRKPRVEPLPRIRPHETFIYTASQLTDPFSSGNLGRLKPSPEGGLAPDSNRRKEPLEQYPLDSLRMVGTLSRGALSWVILSAPDGTVHRATEGNYLGQNFGRITKVSDIRLNITELIISGTGKWVERKTNLAIVR